MPPLADLSFAGLDDFVYRPTANKTSASVSQVKAISDDEDIFQSNDLQATDKPSFKMIEFTNARNESVKPKQAEKPSIFTQTPNYSHLIKDYDFHEKRMAKKSILKNMGKNTGQREIRPVWNSSQRINHQNKFVPSTVLTRISNEKVNTVRVNDVNTAGQTVVSTVKGTRVTTVKASSGCVWRPKMTNLTKVSKDNSGSWVSKRGNLQQALKNKGIINSECSRHMTGNKDFLIDYQDIDGGFVAFGGSTKGGKITGKGKDKDK
ncbi:hypothetical protein Tco_1373382 [Tanacetum coccineum]